jgi:predicted glycoside hydrolase/deacetylase ChbG (UPF0249 family)
MKTNRRDFIQTMGAGAIGLGISATVPSVTAQSVISQANQVTKTGGRKMVFRADDIGFSKVCNIGSFEAIENGVVTVAAIMLDSPGTEDALERLKKLPWISVEWHMHMWGAPVSDPKQVSSLVENDGEFAGRFKTNLTQATEVVYEEALLELRAQLDKCIKILGRVPDTGGGNRGTSPWGKAVKQVSDEYGLVYNFTSDAAPVSDKWIEHIKAAKKAGEEWAKFYEVPGKELNKCDGKWTNCKIFNPGGTNGTIDLLTDSISSVEKNYDPVRYYTEDPNGILKYPEDWILTKAWHPGYVDYYVYRLGERRNRARAQQFVVGRTQDVSAMCDPRLKNWIKVNKIELVNFRDALYGTREYQNHLKLVGSELAIN